ANTVEAVEDSVVAIGYTEDCGNGSGVIISKDGFIVTNNHVVNGYEELYVALNDGTVHSAYVWASDEQTDLAVIKINTDRELSAAVFGNSSEVRKGESVIVIGNPTGELKGSVSAGIISHDSRIMSIEGNIMELIQTDASVNPGNSGGGLFNTYGELIGIVNAKIVATTVESIGFAIPSNNVLAIVEDLLEYKYVTGRPYVGLNMKVVTKATYGGFVTEYIVTESKYCEDIKPGDKILSVGGKNIGEYTSQQLLYGYSIGDEIEIVLIRDSKTIVVTVVLQEYRP
ncbi:MAG: trypsin-like peptidase domain-containing protein, partial [Clostridia bacterium]|nr:trypsin-like peptidase domain-containing protein [Clostridia bacterium]